MAALQVRLQKGEDTSGFLLGRGEKVLPNYKNGKAGWDIGHAGAYNNDDIAGNVLAGCWSGVFQVPTPFSAGFGKIGSFQTIVYYCVFLVAMIMSATAAINKLLGESLRYEDSGTADGVLDSATMKCGHKATDDGSCHKYHQMDVHVLALLNMMAILPWIAIAVSIFYYGFWYMPMSSLNGFNATIGTVYYAHLLLIFTSNVILLAWIADGSGTTGDPNGSPYAGTRANAGKNTESDDIVFIAFIFNALTVAGSIAFPLTALAMKVMPDAAWKEMMKSEPAATVAAGPVVSPEAQGLTRASSSYVVTGA
jgi:hypothetical protein